MASAAQPPSTAPPSPTGELVGKSVLITGATSGIGRATVQLAVRAGARVVATGRSQEALDALARETGCFSVQADLTVPGACERVVTEAVKLLDGTLSGLVNCAGVLRANATENETLESFTFSMTHNVQTVFEMTQHAIPHLRRYSAGGAPTDGGSVGVGAGVDAGAEGTGTKKLWAAPVAPSASIVNVSSVNGKQAFAGVAAYCASKAAVDMLSQCAAVDLAKFNIRVNAVNPGVVASGFQLRGGLSDAAYSSFLTRSHDVTHPLAASRPDALPQPEDAAELIVFLLSERSKWITGDRVSIDGGRTCLGAR